MKHLLTAVAVVIGLAGTVAAQPVDPKTSPYPNLTNPIVLVHAADLPNVAECNGILSQNVLDLVNNSTEDPADTFERNRQQHPHMIMMPPPLECASKLWRTLRSPRFTDFAKVPSGTEAVSLREYPAKSLFNVRALAAAVGSNVDLAGGVEGYQGENNISIDPNNPLHMVAHSNTFFKDPNPNCLSPTGGAANTFGTMALFGSTDGGANWTYNCAPWPAGATGGVTGATAWFGSDPALSWDSAGRAYACYMLISQNNTGSAFGASIVVARSSDNGASWQNLGIVVNDVATNGIGDDKEMMAIDNTSGQPFSHPGRLYVIWDQNNAEVISHSDDGVAWTKVALPSNTGAIGGNVVIGADGTVYIIWTRYNLENIVFSKSTDGGTTWTAPQVISTIALQSFGSNNKPPAQDKRGINGFGSIDIDRNPASPYFGNLYVSFPDFPAGTTTGADINTYVIRSTNGGTSWSSRVKVNDDNFGATQFFPWLAVDQSDGTVNVSWYDSRLDPLNRKTQLVYARSSDGGVSFEPNVLVTDGGLVWRNNANYADENSVDNISFNANQYGDYSGIAALNRQVHPLWTDSRSFFPLADTVSPTRREDNASSAVVNCSAPAAISAPSVNPTTAPSVVVSWSAPAGWGTNATSGTYAVYRNTSSTFPGGAPLVSGLTSTSYVDTTGTPSTTYFYFVRARNNCPGTALTPMTTDSSASAGVVFGAAGNAVGTLQGTVTSAGNPVSGATVTAGALSATTNGGGFYSFPAIDAGTYTVAAGAPGYAPASVNGVVVSGGATTVQNLALIANASSACFTDTTFNDFSTGIGSNVDIVTSAGSVQLTVASGGPNVPDVNSTDSSSSGTGFTSTQWLANPFTATKSGTLTRVDLLMFCSGCSGANPNVIVEIRSTAAGAPVGGSGNPPVLATATITGFSSGTIIAYSANFATPITVVPGTTYAVTVHSVTNRATGTYALIRTAADNGIFRRYASLDSGTTWSSALFSGGPLQFEFIEYVTQPLVYSAAGTLTSATKDSNSVSGSSATWTTLSWNATTPPNTTVSFQAAASNSAAGPFNFVGPDGTAGTFFTVSGASLAQFNGKRYLKYKAYLSTSDTSTTPVLSDVTVCEQVVDCAPFAAITTPSSVCANSVGNTASAPAGLSTYAWSITNGTITSATNLQSITYDAGASGTVTLNVATTATNGCSASNSIPVTINALPPAPITISNLQTVTVTGGSGVFTLTFNGQTTAPLAFNASAAAVQAALNGLPSIGGVGGSAVVNLSANVYTVTFGGTLAGPQPQMVPGSGGGATAVVRAAGVCANSAGNQASGPPGATTYAWTITNGAITSAGNVQTITYTAGASGDVTLNLTVTNAAGCSGTSAPATILINLPPPVPTIAGTTNGTGTQDQACPGQPLTLTATSAGATSFQWYKDIDLLPGETNSTYQATGAATYYVTATANGCTSAQSAGYVVQNPTPHSPFVSFRGQDSSVTTLAICQGSSQIIDSDSATGIHWWKDGVDLGPGSQSLTVTQAGVYTAQLNALGCLSQFGRNVTVTVDAMPPTPTISGDTNGTGTQDQACPEQPLTLHANGATGATSYTWYSDNAVIPNESTSTLVMTGVGNISVTATNGTCTTAHSATYVVQNPTPHSPFISFRGQASTVTTLSICQGTSQIIDSDSATGIQWYKDGVAIAVNGNSQSYTATGLAPGTYVFTAQLNALGCHSQFGRNVTLTVNALPATPTATPGGPTTFCAGGSVTLTSSAASGNQWFLNGNPIGGATNTTYIANATGSYTVKTTDVNTCTSAASNAVVVTVNPLPATPTITPGGPTTFCAGGSVTLTSSAASGNQWYLNGNPIGGATNTTYSATASGNYTVTTTDGNGCTSAASAATSVTVNPIPATPTITPGGPTTFCAGGSVTLTSSSASGNQWFLNGNPIGGATNNTYSATATGSYTVKVTTTGCTSAASAATSVTVNPIPATPTITPGGPTTFCAGGSVTLTSSSASGNQWYLNGNPIGGATAQTYPATASGSYTVIVTASGCSSAASAPTAVTVNPNPNATITAPASVTTGSTGNVASTANAGAGATYAWSITNGTITGGNNTPSITFTAGAAPPGTLTINLTVTTSAGCSDTKSANVNRVLPVVTVTSVVPNFGTVTGGTSVTINGTNFAAGATVTFGGTAATNVVVVSSIKITAKTPAHTAGAVNVTVTNTDTSTGTLTNGYMYQAQVFDPNGDGVIDPADIFFLINYLFTGGPAPHGPAGILSGDANGDGVVDPADIFYLVNYLFLGGQKPNRPTSITDNPRATAIGIGNEAPEIAGSIALGKPVLRAGHYFVPVVVTSRGSVAPQSMSLKLHVGGETAIGDVIVRRAGAAKDLPTVFETSRRSGNDVSYLVAYDPRGLTFDASRSAIVAEIEIAGADETLTVSIDPQLTMLSNQGGTSKATVANGHLEVRGTAAPGDSSPRPRKPGHEVM